MIQYHLKYRVAAFAGLIIVAFFGGPASAAPPNKKGPNQNLPPLSKQSTLWTLERIQLCDNNQIKPEIANPTCERWQIGNVGSNPAEDAVYAQNFPKECYNGSDGNFRCFFPKSSSSADLPPVRACRAYAKASSLYKDMITPNSGMTPFCGTGAYATPGGQVDTTQFRCSLCDRNQNGCTPSGKYIPGEVCDFSTQILKLENIVDQTGYSFCDTVINGPYRNLADNYSACGVTQTQAYRGMIFPLDQKAQIKGANRAGNMQKLTSDMAGFCYPKSGMNLFCQETSPGSGMCIEPSALVESVGAWNSAEVHHVLPRKDRRGCACGANSMKNAAVISRSLNSYLSNQNRNGIVSACNPMITEVDWINGRPAYPAP